MFTYDQQKSKRVSSEVLSGVSSRPFSAKKDMQRSTQCEKSGVQDFSSISILPRSRSSIQPKLKINAPNDRYEQEADRIADQVLQTSGQSVQRACHRCKSDDEQIQTKTKGSGGQTASLGFTNQLAANRQGGHTLNADTKSFMESGMGADFSKVRIHADAHAARLSEEIDARAFTLNNHIYFNKGEYAPESYEGKRLLAHELVHTLQQSGASSLVQKEDKEGKKKKEKKKVKHDVKVEVVRETDLKKGKSKTKGKTKQSAEEKVDDKTTAKATNETSDSDKKVTAEVKRKFGNQGFYAGAGVSATQSFSPSVADNYASHIKIGGKWSLLDDASRLSSEMKFSYYSDKGPKLTMDNRIIFFPNGTLTPEIAAGFIYGKDGFALTADAMMRYQITHYLSAQAGVSVMWNPNDTLELAGTAGVAFYLW